MLAAGNLPDRFSAQCLDLSEPAPQSGQNSSLADQIRASPRYGRRLGFELSGFLIKKGYIKFLILFHFAFKYLFHLLLDIKPDNLKIYLLTLRIDRLRLDISD